MAVKRHLTLCMQPRACGPGPGPTGPGHDPVLGDCAVISQSYTVCDPHSMLHPPPHQLLTGWYRRPPEERFNFLPHRQGIEVAYYLYRQGAGSVPPAQAFL